MKIRHTIVVAIMSIITSAASAQEVIDYASLFFAEQKPQKTWLYMQLGYEHSQSHASNVNTEMTFVYNATDWFDFYGGFHISTRNLYELAVRGDFKWNVSKSRFLALKNQYTYSVYASENMQDMNMLLMAVYDQEYFRIGVGGYAQFMTPCIMMNNAQRTYIWEPGIAYDIEARIFKKKHIWNLGLQITNVRDYLVERVYSPNFILNGNYRIAGEGERDLNLELEAGFQPAGFMNITTNYYSFFFNVGITCRI